MKAIDQINRLKMIHKMIERELTGNPEKFASSLSVSKRQLFNIIEEIKLMGAPVLYDKILKTYRYNRSYEKS